MFALNSSFEKGGTQEFVYREEGFSSLSLSFSFCLSLSLCLSVCCLTFSLSFYSLSYLCFSLGLSRIGIKSFHSLHPYRSIYLSIHLQSMKPTILPAYLPYTYIPTYLPYTYIPAYLPGPCNPAQPNLFLAVY